MATLHIHDVSDQIARAYLNVPKEQQQRLKRILEETISLCTEASSSPATPTQESTLVYENEARQIMNYLRSIQALFKPI